MDGVERRRRAAVLLIVAWALALHAWIPALLAIGFVSWVILHKRLEGDFGDALARRCQRGWPPGRLILMLLFGASTLVAWESDVRTLAKVLPVTLHIFGLSMILFGGWSTPVRWKMAVPAKRTA
jgi:hypothetical protein